MQKNQKRCSKSKIFFDFFYKTEKQIFYLFDFQGKIT